MNTFELSNLFFVFRNSFQNWICKLFIFFLGVLEDNRFEACRIRARKFPITSVNRIVFILLDYYIRGAISRCVKGNVDPNEFLNSGVSG